MTESPLEGQVDLDGLTVLTLTDLRHRLRAHALWKVGKCEQVAVHLLAGFSQREICERLHLDREQFAGVRRWLQEALLVEDRYGAPSREDLSRGMSVVADLPAADPGAAA